MANEDERAYDLDDEFDQLFQDVELEDDGDAVIRAEEAPTTEDTLAVAAVEGSQGVAIDGAGSCHEPIPVTQHLQKQPKDRLCP